ncbi:hypothetical protein D3C72_1304520 [compost metagenome]
MRVAHGVEPGARAAGQKVQLVDAGQDRDHRPHGVHPFRQTGAPCLETVGHPSPGGTVRHARRQALQSADRQAQLQGREVAMAGIEDLQGHGVDHGREGGADISLHRVPQPHGLARRQVDEQAVGQERPRTFGRPLAIRMARTAIRASKGFVARRLLHVPWRGRRLRRVLRADQAPLEAGQPVMAEHGHDPGPSLGLDRVVVAGAMGLQGLVDGFQASVHLRRKGLPRVRLADQPVVLGRQGRDFGGVRLRPLDRDRIDPSERRDPGELHAGPGPLPALPLANLHGQGLELVHDQPVKQGRVFQPAVAVLRE